MSSKIPTVREIAWISIIPQLLVMLVIMLIWMQFTATNFIMYGAITYLIISQFLRRTITKEHRNGMSRIKTTQFEQAIQYFSNSYEFFKENHWLDKYRYLTLLSSSSMSYKEMALINIAYCYNQLGNRKLSKEFYEKTLDEYPSNGMALASLKLLNTLSQEDIK